MITISLCMIVRNEEKTLGRCLRSVDGIADEIVVVDTGSEDQTKAVAAECGARVVDFAWVDDFAAARNHSFEQATMDYILWLDADDVLLPEDRAKLLELKNTLSPVIDAVSMSYNTAFDPSGNVIASARRFRLVRRSLNVRWAGVVHEDLEFSGHFHVLNTDIVVTHQKPPSDSGPSRRNLEIFERHLAAGRPMSVADVFHYARELQMNKEFARAIPFHQQFLDSDNSDVNHKLFALHNLATCYYMIGEFDKEWECTLRSLEYDVPRPEFACRFGERFISKNQFHQAIYWYEQALCDYETEAGEWAVHSYPYKTWLPHKQLGRCYFELGDYGRSLHHTLIARDYLPADAAINANITMLEELVGVAPHG